MKEKTIDAILGSPEEREELIVELYHHDGPLWGELYRENGDYWLDILDASEARVFRVDADELQSVLTKALAELRSRIENA